MILLLLLLFTLQKDFQCGRKTRLHARVQMKHFDLFYISWFIYILVYRGKNNIVVMN